MRRLRDSQQPALADSRDAAAKVLAVGKTCRRAFGAAPDVRRGPPDPAALECGDPSPLSDLWKHCSALPVRRGPPTPPLWSAARFISRVAQVACTVACNLGPSVANPDGHSVQKFHYGTEVALVQLPGGTLPLWQRPLAARWSAQARSLTSESAAGDLMPRRQLAQGFGAAPPRNDEFFAKTWPMRGAHRLCSAHQPAPNGGLINPYRAASA